MLASLPDLRDGSLRPTRLVKRIGDAWFAIGPVAVFALADTAPSHAGPWLLLAALSAQFGVDFVVSAVRFRISDAVSLREHARSSWVFVIDMALSGVALVVAEEIHRAPYAPLAVLPLLGLLSVFAREREARLDQLIELNHAYHGTALVLGDVVEADDGYTGEHSRGVVRLCLEVATRLGLNAEQKRNLEFGALLHDVGKIAIPKEIINKPGQLDEHEWEIIRTHTVEGQKLLDTVGGFMREVGPDRALPPRALGRRRLSGRTCRRGDPLGVADRLLLRHLERDAHRSLLPQAPALQPGGAGDARGGGHAAGPARCRGTARGRRGRGSGSGRARSADRALPSTDDCLIRLTSSPTCRACRRLRRRRYPCPEPRR